MCSIALQNSYMYNNTLLVTLTAIQLSALPNIPANTADSNKV